jgi:hypothetical protein
VVVLFFLPWKRKNKYYGGKINRRTGAAKISSQGEKYDMYWGKPSILMTGGKGTTK